MYLGRRGFTLVEQLIVVALIVSVLAFGGIRFIEISRQNEWNHTISSLTAALRFVQMRSVQDGQIYSLSLDESKKHLVLKRKTDADADFKIVASHWLQNINIGRSFELDIDRQSAILFYPDGSTSQNHLVLHKENGERASLFLKNRIGSIQVANG